jgi:glycosyltransferase involved in cell wall biosynthesis
LYSQSCFLAKKLELENVKFITKYSEDELLSAIDNSDLYIGLVGETDRARRVIAAKTFKGFAMRKCVINGRSGAMDELFEADKDYAAVKFADVDDLVKKIKSLRKNKKEIERIAKHGYETFNKHGDVPTVAEELLSILEAIR